MKIHHFAIEVKDIDKSIEFYTKKLDFIIKTPKTQTEDNKYLYVNIGLGGVELELIQILDKQTQKKEKSTPRMCPHIALESDDFDRDFEELKKRGVLIFDGPHVIPNDVKMLTILDPDSYRIDIGQLLK